MKKLYSILVILLTCLVAQPMHADEQVVINGLQYNLLDAGTATVIGYGVIPNDLVIPAQVTYNNVTYTVTKVQGGSMSIFGGSSITSVTFPNTMLEIGDRSFANCMSLTSVAFSNSITKIGEYAFNRCQSLTSVTLPASIEEIGASAFFGCNLTEVTMEGLVPPTFGTWVFNHSDYSAVPIYVPAEAFLQYYCATTTNTPIQSSLQVREGLFTVKFIDRIPNGLSYNLNVTLCASDPQTEQLVAYGQSAIAPNPTTSEAYPSSYPFGHEHYGYTWGGWDVSFAEVTQNLTVYSRYVATPYNVIFYNDNDVLEEAVFESGSTPFYSLGTPSKASDAEHSYEFLGWATAQEGGSIYTGELPALTHNNTEYWARYTAVARKYTVTFEDENGNVLETTEYGYGSFPTYTGTTPAKANLTFAGWSPALSAITADVTYTPVFKAEVVFTDEWGIEWQKSLVEVGETPSYTGSTPYKDADAQYSYEFAGSWTPAIGAVSQNTTYTAVFNKTLQQYVVQFLSADGNQVYQSAPLDYGTMPVYNGADLSYTAEGTRYTHTGWSPAIAAVTQAQNYYAQFSTTTRYFVTFYDCDGVTVLQSGWVDEGTAAVAPTASHNEHKTITDWDKDFSNVQSALDIYAECETDKFQVTVIAEHGTVVAHEVLDGGANGEELDLSQPIEYGTAVRLEVVPDEGYKRTGWTNYQDDPNYFIVENDITITAHLELRTFTVTFVDWDDTPIGEAQTISYNEEAVAPQAPEHEGYTFTGWDKTFDAVTEDMTIKAQYEINRYDVTVIAEHGSVQAYRKDNDERIDLTGIAWGTTIYLEPFTSELYEFVGWSDNYDPETGLTVTEDITITATFELKEVEDGLDEILFNAVSVQKIMVDGQLYILREDALYDARGARVK